MERRKRRRAGGFGFDTAERRTVLLWCLTGVGGSVAFSMAFLCFSIEWGAIWKEIRSSTHAGQGGRPQPVSRSPGSATRARPGQ